jgi:hypothetical protein
MVGTGIAIDRVVGHMTGLTQRLAQVCGSFLVVFDQ